MLNKSEENNIMAFGKNQDILCHILRYCYDITEDLSTIENYNEFFNNRMCKNSVGMSIAQIGELATHLSDEYINATISQIPWHQIRGMRNVIVHNYLKVDIEKMWLTAKEDIPKLKAFCEEQISIFNLLNQNSQSANECAFEDEEDEEAEI